MRDRVGTQSGVVCEDVNSQMSSSTLTDCCYNSAYCSLCEDAAHKSFKEMETSTALILQNGGGRERRGEGEGKEGGRKGRREGVWR